MQIACNIHNRIIIIVLCNYYIGLIFGKWFIHITYKHECSQKMSIHTSNIILYIYIYIFTSLTWQMLLRHPDSWRQRWRRKKKKNLKHQYHRRSHGLSMTIWATACLAADPVLRSSTIDDWLCAQGFTSLASSGHARPRLRLCLRLHLRLCLPFACIHSSVFLLQSPLSFSHSTTWNIKP